MRGNKGIVSVGCRCPRNVLADTVLSLPTVVKQHTSTAAKNCSEAENGPLRLRGVQSVKGSCTNRKHTVQYMQRFV